MPGGRTHDVITILLAVPAAAAAFALTSSVSAAVLAGSAFIFGGLMFGPDLDTGSRQFARWGFFRFLWAPYRYFFSHRSRFTHGLILGALLRVIYFLGAVTLAALIGAYAIVSIKGGRMPGVEQIADFWRPVGDSFRGYFGKYALLIPFAGLWAGAASHTVTDIVGTFVKTGRLGKVL